MGETSEISWTDATHNEWIGCTRVSPGCQHCYAETLMDTRYGRVKWGKGQPRVLTSEANRKKPHAWNRTAERARKLWAQRVAVGSPPPRPRVFSASLSDWLDHEVDPAWLAGLLSTVAATPELDWLLLTKRPQLWRARLVKAGDAADLAKREGARVLIDQWLNGYPPPNVWAGTTVEDQQRADERVPHLLAIPARVRFLSCEPLLGPIDLSEWLGRARCTDCGATGPQEGGQCFEFCDDSTIVDMPNEVHWIIAGGESGHGARPMHPAWARSLRDQAVEAGVAFHFKQHGEWAPAADLDIDLLARTPVTSERYYALPEGGGMLRVGKTAAGRLLDGRTWDELPVTRGR